MSRHNILTSLSFQILDLLADLFKLGFHANDQSRNSRVTRLRSNCICLAIEFLKKEVKRSADGLC